MHIHARSLNYFDMIRRCGSIREAARQLHVASSAVNRQLLQLEAEIGAPLFERMSTGLRLTPAGEVFSLHVITVLQDEKRMAGELDMLRGVRRGSISLITVDGLSADFTPACLERMAARYPTIQVKVRTAGSARIAKAVIEGDADVGIGFAFERTPELRQCAVGRFALGAIVRADHPLAAARQVSFAECARYPLVLPTDELSTHALVRSFVAHYRGRLQVLLETSSVELAKSIAARGLGVAFQTRLGIERELAQGEMAYVPLRSQARLFTELGAYVRNGRALPTAVSALITIVGEEIESRVAAESR
jgi:DNA-binding transcriptional LysR family regulator